MNTSDIVIGDNLFKLPPKSAKAGGYVTRGRNKQLVTYHYDTTQPLFTSREFRLKTGLISCVLKHIVEDDEYKGYIEFTINELWTACGGQRRLYNPQEFEDEVMRLLMKLNTVTCSFSNFKGYKKAKRVLDRIDDDRLQSELNTLCDCIFTDRYGEANYLQATICNYKTSKGKASKAIHVEGIPVEAAFAILSDSLRTINGDEFLKPLKIRMKDKVFLIALFSATRIKHDEFNRSKPHPYKNSDEILTSHIYDLVGADTRQLQLKARQAVEAIFNGYHEIGKIGGWNWIAKGKDKYYKITFNPPQ